MNNAQDANPNNAVFTIRNVRVDEAVARFAGDAARYKHWLVEFIAHGPAAAQQIRQAATSGSVEAATKLAHALKGRTGMLGMVELHAICLALEMALRNGEPAINWLDELDSAVATMVNDISVALGLAKP